MCTHAIEILKFLEKTAILSSPFNELIHPNLIGISNRIVVDRFPNEKVRESNLTLAKDLVGVGNKRATNSTCA